MFRVIFAAAILFSAIESALHAEQDGLNSILQKRKVANHGDRELGGWSGSDPVHGVTVAPAGCSKLTNHDGAYFTLSVGVGTPSQNFELVVDTGSDSVIVASCDCSDCKSVDKCFKGNISDSSSFVAPTPIRQNGKDDTVALLRITFGSGTIFAEVASDMVQMGGISANMTDGLLLMMSQQLNVELTFAGIFGIGLPRDAASTKKIEQVQKRLQSIAEQRSKDMPPPPQQANPFEGMDAGALQDTLRKMGFGGVQLQPPSPHFLSAKARDDFTARLRAGPPSMQSGAGAGDIDQGAWEDMLNKIFQHPGMGDAEATAGNSDDPEEELEVEQKEFMVTAGVERFSMCFGGDAAGNGQLLINTPKAPKSLGNLGASHWALGLAGISVGQDQKPLGGEAALCTDKATDKGLAMNCGAIPDSGTTLIMAPQAHVDVLLETLCDGWQRCRENRTALDAAKQAAITASEDVYGAKDPFGLSTVQSPAADVLKFVLSDCHRWLDKERSDEQLNEELPAVHFRLEGSDNSSQLLSIEPSRYILEQFFETSNASEVQQLEERLGVKLPDRFCDVAFGAMEYSTEMNGPIWILGTPLFYQYQVGYDLQGLSVSFTEGEPCGTCGEPPSGTSALVGEGAKVQRSGLRGLRQLSGRPRLPSYKKLPKAL